jgi:hypothetical protein
MNNVNPSPMRGVLTGFDVVLAVDVGPDVAGVVLLFSGCFFVVVTVDFGRLRLGLAAAPEFAGFLSFREVRKAPRTSSPSCTAGAAIPMTTTQRQTNVKTITLNLMEFSLFDSLAIEVLSGGCGAPSQIF